MAIFFNSFVVSLMILAVYYQVAKFPVIFEVLQFLPKGTTIPKEYEPVEDSIKKAALNEY